MTTLTYEGRPACLCQVEWFPAFRAELKARGLPDINIAQLIGSAKASAKVHSQGGAADWWGVNAEVAAVARMMGAPATWVRETGSFAKNKHTHSVLRGCPHAHAEALAQIREVMAGGDGLRGDADDDPRLRDFRNERTWRQGIAWHEAQELRRVRIAKIEKAKKRRAKWKKWLKKNRVFIDNLKAKL